MKKPLPKHLQAGISGSRRRVMSVTSGELVTMRPLFAEGLLPLLIEPAEPGSVALIEWARRQRPLLQEKLCHHGGILFRGFDVDTEEQFENFIEAVSGSALEYKERSSPRSQITGKIYSSTDFPADQTIFLHNENSYQSSFPLRIFFFCVIPPATGGETPIADCRRVYQRLSEATKKRFSERQWMYRRNFGDGFGLPWQTVFQTEDRTVVEDYCAGHGIAVEWKAEGRLRTEAVRSAIARHPVTDELTWFNHATIFNVSTLETIARDALLEEFSEADLPSNSYFGDGGPIAAETLEELRQAYHAETVAFPWQKGDILLLDNMLVAHGRQPFAGPRKIAVGMAEPRSWQDIDSQIEIGEEVSGRP